MDYHQLYDTLTQLPTSASVSDKKKALREVATALLNAKNADFELRVKAADTMGSLDSPGAEDTNWIDSDIAKYISQLNNLVVFRADSPGAAGGRRKKRRGKKTKKAKKTHRYTRRR